MAVPIVFLHGFTHTGASWRPVIDGLGQRYRALAPDLRGHGSAGDARPIGFAECVADVAALTPEAFTLVGYSLGARLALNVALDRPGRVRRLVLVSGSPGIADDAEREQRRRNDEELAQRIEQDGLEAFLRMWEAQPLFKGQSAEVVEAVRADRRRSTAAGLAAALRGLGTGAMAPMWSQLQRLRMPVTAIVGERDARYRKLAERVVALAPDAELVIVPSVGHAVHLEAPALVAETLHERVSATWSAHPC